MIGIIISASSEDDVFPNKVFSKIAGKTILEHVVAKALSSEYAQKVIVSMPSSDRAAIHGSTLKDPIIDANLVRLKRRPIFHFHESKSHIVRAYYAALEHELDYIVRISADCPLLPAWLYSAMMLEYQYKSMNGYMRNTPLPSQSLTDSFEDGLDVEILPFWMLAYGMLHTEHENDYPKNIADKFGFIQFKNIDANRIPVRGKTLRFISKDQMVEFEYMLTELAHGADLEDVIIEGINA